MLIVPQIFAVWISHEKGISRLQPAADLDLTGLSREINRQWGRSAEQTGVWKGEVSGSANDELLKRESLMMQLRTIESALVERGIEMEIVEDLEAYFATLSGDENLMAVNRYIQSLLEWVDPHAGSDSECSLDRLAVLPGVGSVLPGIAFELSGNPGEMARRIRQSNRDGLGWELRDMDLVSLKKSGNWWMRGICSYPDRQDL
jgi:hypothetical protein